VRVMPFAQIHRKGSGIILDDLHDFCICFFPDNLNASAMAGVFRISVCGTSGLMSKNGSVGEFANGSPTEGSCSTARKSL